MADPLYLSQKTFTKEQLQNWRDELENIATLVDAGEDKQQILDAIEILAQQIYPYDND